MHIYIGFGGILAAAIFASCAKNSAKEAERPNQWAYHAHVRHSYWTAKNSQEKNDESTWTGACSVVALDVEVNPQYVVRPLRQGSRFAAYSEECIDIRATVTDLVSAESTDDALVQKYKVRIGEKDGEGLLTVTEFWSDERRLHFDLENPSGEIYHFYCDPAEVFPLF